MRLVGALHRLEVAGASAAAAAAAQAQTVGIAWVTRDRRVDAAALRVGEYIAVDVTRLDDVANPAHAWAGADGVSMPLWDVAERVTTDVGDLGVFYVSVSGAEPVRAGVVVAIDTDMVRYELDSFPGVEREFGRQPPVDWE